MKVTWLQNAPIPHRVIEALLSKTPIPKDYFCPQCIKAPNEHDFSTCDFVFFYDSDAESFGWEKREPTISQPLSGIVGHRRRNDRAVPSANKPSTPTPEPSVPESEPLPGLVCGTADHTQPCADLGEQVKPLLCNIRNKSKTLENLTEEEIVVLRASLGRDWRFKLNLEYCHRDENDNIIPGSCECDYCRDV